MNSEREKALLEVWTKVYSHAPADVLIEAHRKAHDAKWLTASALPILVGVSASVIALGWSLDLQGLPLVLVGILAPLLGWDYFVYQFLQEKFLLRLMQERNERLK
jgi:hypothetical protein